MSFFKSIRRAVGVEATEKDEEEKQVLIDSFNSAVKNFIREHREVDASISRHNVRALEICSAVEDILCHGLKWHGIVANPPEYPRLWEVLRTISHADTVQNLEELPLDTVDVKCKAWIRVAMNEGLCANYIHALLDASHATLLSTHYGIGAFLRDAGLEKPDMMCSMFRAIEPYKFNMSLGELCSIPSVPDPGPSTPGVSSNRQDQPSDWSDVAAVTVVSGAFVPPDSSVVPTTPKKKSKDSGGVSPASPKSSSKSHSKGDRGTPKRTRKNRRGHQRVRSIGDGSSPDWKDDTRPDSTPAVDAIDSILSPVLMSQTTEVNQIEDSTAHLVTAAESTGEESLTPVTGVHDTNHDATIELTDANGEPPVTRTSTESQGAAAASEIQDISTSAPVRNAPSSPKLLPGIRDPMAAPAPVAAGSPKAFRAGVRDPMAGGVEPVRPRSNTGSMDWMIRQAAREARQSVSAPSGLPPSSASDPPQQNVVPDGPALPVSSSTSEHQNPVLKETVDSAPSQARKMSSSEPDQNSSTGSLLNSPCKGDEVSDATPGSPGATESTANTFNEQSDSIEPSRLRDAVKEEECAGEPSTHVATVGPSDSDTMTVVESSEKITSPQAANESNLSSAENVVDRSVASAEVSTDSGDFTALESKPILDEDSDEETW